MKSLLSTALLLPLCSLAMAQDANADRIAEIKKMYAERYEQKSSCKEITFNPTCQFFDCEGDDHFASMELKYYKNDKGNFSIITIKTHEEIFHSGNFDNVDELYFDDNKKLFFYFTMVARSDDNSFHPDDKNNNDSLYTIENRYYIGTDGKVIKDLEKKFVTPPTPNAKRIPVKGYRKGHEALLSRQLPDFNKDQYERYKKIFDILSKDPNASIPAELGGVE